MTTKRIRRFHDACDISHRVLSWTINQPFSQTVTVVPHHAPVRLRRRLWFQKVHPKVQRPL